LWYSSPKIIGTFPHRNRALKANYSGCVKTGTQDGHRPTNLLSIPKNHAMNALSSVIHTHLGWDML